MVSDISTQKMKGESMRTRAGSSAVIRSYLNEAFLAPGRDVRLSNYVATAIKDLGERIVEKLQGEFPGGVTDVKMKAPSGAGLHGWEITAVVTDGRGFTYDVKFSIELPDEGKTEIVVGGEFSYKGGNGLKKETWKSPIMLSFDKTSSMIAYWTLANVKKVTGEYYARPSR